MTTVYTPVLRLWEGQQGDPAIANAWGTPNSENMSLVEQAISGVGIIDLTGQSDPFTLSTANGAPDQARNNTIAFSGTLTADITVNIPNQPRIAYVINITSGGHNVTLSAGSGTKAVISNFGGAAAVPLWQYSADGSGNVGIVSAGYDAVVFGGDANFFINKVTSPIRWILSFQDQQFIDYDGTDINVNTTTGDINLDPIPGGNVTFCNNDNFLIKNNPSNFYALSFQPNQFVSYDSNTGDCTMSFTAGVVSITGGRSATIGNFGFLNNVNPTGIFPASGPKTVGLNVAQNVVANEFDALSDERLKSNIVPISERSAIDWVRRSRGVTYLKDGSLSSGFIAQEQADVLPHSLSAAPRKGMAEYRSERLNVPHDHALTLAYNTYIPYLQTALKAALDRIEALELKLSTKLAEAAD